MFSLAAISYGSSVLAARGRGIARLIEGLWNGEPVTWIIVGVVVAVMVAMAVFKKASGASEGESESAGEN